MNLYFCAYADSFLGGGVQKIPAPDSRQAAMNFLAFQGWFDTERPPCRVAVHVQSVESTRCSAYRVRKCDCGPGYDPSLSCVYLGPVDQPLAPTHWLDSPARTLCA